MLAVCVPNPACALREVFVEPPLDQAVAVMTFVDDVNSSVAAVRPDGSDPKNETAAL
jgi:hypothetical protein